MVCPATFRRASPPWGRVRSSTDKDSAPIFLMTMTAPRRIYFPETSRDHSADHLARAIVAVVRGRNDVDMAAKICRTLWPDDTTTRMLVQRSTVSPADTVTAAGVQILGRSCLLTLSQRWAARLQRC